LITITDKYFPALAPVQKHRLSLLHRLYREWNQRINVISRKDIDNFEINHLLHSLAIARFVSFVPGTTVLDVGTGGGLPGIPLAVIFPETQFTLVDSIAKKIRVAEAIASEAGLDNVKTVASRVEDLRGSYDFIIGRAVTETGKLVKLTRHLISPRSLNIRKNGWILLKGGDLQTELGPLGQAAEVTAISDWFDEPFFETKKIVWLPH
jgi:16S rRNA (guanine527-N7)-methyltransferase